MARRFFIPPLSKKIIKITFISVQRCFLTEDHSGRASDQSQEEWPCRENNPHQGCQTCNNGLTNNQLRSLSIHLLFVKNRWEEEEKRKGRDRFDPRWQVHTAGQDSARSKVFCISTTLQNPGRKAASDSSDICSQLHREWHIGNGGFS